MTPRQLLAFLKLVHRNKAMFSVLLGSSWHEIAAEIDALIERLEAGDWSEDTLRRGRHLRERLDSGSTSRMTRDLLDLTTPVAQPPPTEEVDEAPAKSLGFSTDIFTVEEEASIDYPESRGEFDDGDWVLDVGGDTGFIEEHYSLDDTGAGLEEAEPAASPELGRNTNLFFAERSGGAPIPPEKPLVTGQTCFLCVEIAPDRRGDAEAPFPEEAVETFWETHEGLPLTVMVTSRDFDIKPLGQTLCLPPEGASETLAFETRAPDRAGEGFLQVDLFYRGFLLQSLRMSATIADVGETEAPPRRADVVFATTDRLDERLFADLPERMLTIVLGVDPRDGTLDLRFLDRRHQREVARSRTGTLAAPISRAGAAVRKVLYTMVAPEHEQTNYLWKRRGDRERLERWLPELADAGRSLYRALFPQSILEDGILPEGTVVQVDPVIGQMTLPWSLIYDHKVRPGGKLCPRFWEDGVCGDCPHRDNPKIVCPSGFWGFRAIIEQIPCWLDTRCPEPKPLIRRIDNDDPLCLNVNVNRTFGLWRDHLARLERAGRLELLVAEEIDQMESFWDDRAGALDLVYFYTHAGKDDLERPMLLLSDGPYTSNHIEACELDWSRHPLVFLNGCGTGDYDALSFTSLISDFRKAGASGVIGTECPVPEMFAEHFASQLLPELLRGEWLGKAMLRVRRQLLTENLNPMGLAYTLFATSEIGLTRPVAEGAST